MCNQQDLAQQAKAELRYTEIRWLREQLISERTRVLHAEQRLQDALSGQLVARDQLTHAIQDAWDYWPDSTKEQDCTLVRRVFCAILVNLLPDRPEEAVEILNSTGLWASPDSVLHSLKLVQSQQWAELDRQNYDLQSQEQSNDQPTDPPRPSAPSN